MVIMEDVSQGVLMVCDRIPNDFSWLQEEEIIIGGEGFGLIEEVG